MRLDHSTANGQEQARQLLGECMQDLVSCVRSAQSPSAVKEALAEPLVYVLHLPAATAYLEGVATKESQPTAPLMKTKDSKFFERLPPGFDALYSQLFLRHFLHAHYEFLLQEVAMSWLPDFSTHERHALFDAYFVPDALVLHNFPSLPFLSLRFLHGALSWSTAPKRVAETILALLRWLLSKWTVRDMSESMSASDCSAGTRAMSVKNTDWEELVTILCFLPDKVANLRTVLTPKFFQTSDYMLYLGRGISTAFNTSSSERDIALSNRIAHLVGKIVRLGHTETLVQTWMPDILKLSQNTPMITSWNDMLGRLSTSEFEKIFFVALERTPRMSRHFEATCDALWSWFGPEALSNEDSMDVIFQKCIYRKVYDTDILRVLVGLMARYPNTSPFSLQKQIVHLIESWGDLTFVNHASHDQHLHMTSLILLCLQRLSVDDMVRNGLVLALLPKMQPYLDSTDLRIRRMGMVTAECFSAKLESKVVLNFEIEDHSETKFLRSLMIEPEPASEAAEKLHLEMSSLAFGSDEDDEEVEIPGPSEPLNVGGKDSDDESEDDLEPYDMPQSQNGLSADTRKAKPPLYIQQLLEGLQIQDDPDRIQVCLEAAVPLIDATPASTLAEVSDALCATLLFLNDTYELPRFAELRSAALSALVVRRPLPSAGLLVTKFYERQVGFTQRLDVLQCIGKAAMELRTGEREDGVSGNAEKAITRSVPRSRTRANAFAPHAAGMLNLLIGGANRAEVAFAVFAGAHGRILLGKLIATAGVVLHCAGNTLDCRRMAREYFDFVWTTRLLDGVPGSAGGASTALGGLRQPILFGLSVIFGCLPSFVLQEEFGRVIRAGDSELTDIQAWLIEVLSSEPKKDTRQLAMSVLRKTENVYADQRERLIGGVSA
ncbi:TEL2, telomere maintenance protein 2 [Geranomyces variabilis]|nr:TEL2, telomere maintenance protein 2 [Geranomyces variabilis]